jgi:hypothetical protein
VYNSERSDVKPLLFSLIDTEWDDVRFLMDKVGILLGAGADVNVRIRYRVGDSVLDREDVSVLERTRRQVCKYRDSESKVKEYERVMREMKNYVRRHSV